MDVCASIIAILQLSNKVLGYLNDVKDAPKDRAKCAVEASYLHSLLLDLRFHLEEGSSNEPWYSAVRDLGAENGALDHFKQALEQLQDKITSGDRLKKVGAALTWKLSKKEVMSLLSSMERLKTLVQVALQRDHFKLSQAIKADICFVQTCITNIETRIDAILQNQDNKRYSELIGWISPTDFPAQQSDFISRRQEGTGQWFLNSPKFAKWLREPKETLFCPGIPGAGKTIIASIAIDHLLRAVRGSAAGVAYVYCNYKDKVGQNTVNLLTAILKQLVQGRPSLIGLIESLHTQQTDGTKLSLDEIIETLQIVMTHYSSVYVVIDALDECPNQDGTRYQFLAQLRKLQNRADLRLMVTSRFIPDIVDQFSSALILEIWARNEDINRFVASQIYRLPRCIQNNSILQNTMQDKIVQAVDGMFLLARLYIDSLLDKRTRSKVRSALEALSKGPKALDSAYRDALERIKSQLPEDTALATNTLSWIICAQRPLTIEEICSALAVQPDDEELDQDNIPDIEDIISVCAGIVTVEKESKIVHLVHYTAQEYFERIQGEWNPHAQLYIASTCLTYLSFSIFRFGSCPTEEDFQNRLKQNVLLDYAAQHWGHHAVTVQEEVRELACLFLQHSGLVSTAAQVMFYSTNKYIFPNLEDRKEETGIHLTAEFGLLYLLNELLSSLEGDITVAVNLENRYNQTPLLLAAMHGHNMVVELLINKGARVDARVRFSNTPLNAASMRGYEQVVKLLVDKGADVNAFNGYYGTALASASAQGHEQVVKLLLDEGANINSLPLPLLAASRGGHEQIVKLLLANGAHINRQDGSRTNALYGASEGGHEQVVRLLLDNGADVNVSTINHFTALSAASARGHEQIVKLLLKNRADPNLAAGISGNALQEASQRGHELIVKLLLENGANVDSQDGGCRTALYAASHGGHEQVVKLLLNNGANVNALNLIGDTALRAASAGGHEQVVKLLLDKRADVNAQAGEYGTALYAASGGGHEQVVRLLLDKGAEINAQINAQTGEYGTALYTASARGHERVVKLLLDNDAEVDAQAGEYGTALYAASARGHEQVVKLLLDKGADANAQTSEYGSAVHVASEGGHQQVVKMLLDKGAHALTSKPENINTTWRVAET